MLSAAQHTGAVLGLFTQHPACVRRSPVQVPPYPTSTCVIVLALNRPLLNWLPSPTPPPRPAPLLPALPCLQGQWKQISRYYVPSRTPTQVASHAQKHFLRQSGAQKRRSRFSAVEEAAAAAVAAGPLQALQLPSPAAPAAPGVPPAAPAAAAAGPVPGAPALPSFFAHALPPAAHSHALHMLSAPPAAGAGRLPGGGQLPPPGAVVGGIAMGVPIGVLPPLPSITTASESGDGHDCRL